MSKKDDHASLRGFILSIVMAHDMTSAEFDGLWIYV